MSRHISQGIHPVTGSPVEVAYGWDFVPTGSAGYFVQVSSQDPKDILPESDPYEFKEHGLILNIGFLHGIRLMQLRETLERFKVTMVPLQKL